MNFFKWMFGPKPAIEVKPKVTAKEAIIKATMPKSVTVEKIKVKVMSKTSLIKLTKDQLEQIGRENGIELDKRKTKEKLVDTLHKKLTKKSK